MKSRLSRPVGVAAGALLVMAVSTGSTQAQQGSGERGGNLKDAFTKSIELPRERVDRLGVAHQICEEFGPAPTPSKA